MINLKVGKQYTLILNSGEIITGCVNAIDKKLKLTDLDNCKWTIPIKVIDEIKEV